MKFLKKLKQYLPEIFMIAGMISILFLMTFLNDIVTDTGFIEFQNNLINMNSNNSNRDFIGMIAKYKLQKGLYENKINDEELNLTELKINSMGGLKEKNFNKGILKYKELSVPAIFIINKIRFIMGEDKIELNLEDPTNQYLDMAYYYERNKFFKSALNVYDKAILITPEKNNKFPIIQLHQGFCYSIIGNYQNAKNKYLTIINDCKDEKIVETAKILLSYINDFHVEITRIQKSSFNPIDKSEKLFKLMAYNEAIGELDKSDPKNKKEQEKVQYFKARSNEELGNTKNAIDLYQNLITKNPKSDYSRLSNRRLLTIGLTSNDKELKTNANENNKKINDKEYQNYSKKIDNIIGNHNDLELKDISDKGFKDKNDFIETMPDTFVKKPAENSSKNKFGELEKLRLELEEKNIALEEGKIKIENLLKNSKKNNLEGSGKESIDQINALKWQLKILNNRKMELENKTRKLEAERKHQEKIQADKILKENVSKNKNKAEIVVNIDQFGKKISEFTYKLNEKNESYLDSYLIYYYMDNNLLYKMMNYDGKNNLIYYYIINYDNQGKQTEVKKYDSYGKIIYLK